MGLFCGKWQLFSQNYFKFKFKIEQKSGNGE